MSDRLTLTQRCVLLVLLAEARELTNAELYGLGGLRLEKPQREQLNERGLIASTKVGRTYAHELTDRGAVWCAEEMGGARPARSGPAGGALYAVLAGLRRYLDGSGQVVAEIFRPDVPSRVVAAYAAVARGGAHPIRLAVLRERLTDVSRDDFDVAIKQLARRDGVHVRSEADQKTLTDQDHDAAVVLGGTTRHLLTIEAAR
ncbi:hypothetical protein AB0H71_15975 [Nocardia sp. NPDC050697]|uniref:hypothetical protein n=1 Tax=Nocardia sp. NPDC050697 TaxID=3155158 RepID=UPI0033F0EE5E